MNKREIEIHISKGILESFAVEIDKETSEINLSATTGLYTDHDKRVSSYSINTRSYYDNNIDLPIGTIPAIQKIAEEIELATIKHCREGQLALPDNN